MENRVCYIRSVLCFWVDFFVCFAVDGGQKIRFDAYIRNLPYYYVNPLRAALKHMNIQNAVPEQVDGNAPFQLIAHIKKLTASAKVETDRFEEVMAALGEKAQERTCERENSSLPLRS